MSSSAADFAALMGLAAGYQRSRALMVATELGIADLLRGGPRPVADLALATRTHEPTLYRSGARSGRGRIHLCQVHPAGPTAAVIEARPA